MSKIRSRIYKDSTRNVAGHLCFMTEIIYDKSILKTYYATDLKIDPESYKGHEVGDWYNRIKEVDGVLARNVWEVSYEIGKDNFCLLTLRSGFSKI